MQIPQTINSFLQRYESLPTLSNNQSKAVVALCKIGEIETNEYNVNRICKTIPANLPPWDLTVSRCIQGFLAATCANHSKIEENFNITNDILFQFTQYLDRYYPTTYGFNYLEILKNECQQILPERWNIKKNTPLEDFCIPIKNFLYSLGTLNNKMIGVALVLLLIKRIIISQPELIKYDIDWSPLINCVNPLFIESMPSMINNAGIDIVETYQDSNKLANIDNDYLLNPSDDLIDIKAV